MIDSPSSILNVTSTNDEFDVVVIGGGLSGLTAALTITEKDTHLKVVVLEATDKIGGRRYVSNEIEGIAFVSETNYFTKQLLSKLNIPIVKRTTSGCDLAELRCNAYETSAHQMPIFGNFLRRFQIERFFAKIEILMEKVSFHTPYSLIESKSYDEMTMEEFICKELSSIEARNFIRNIVEVSCGATPNKISVLFYLALCNSTHGICNQFANDSNGISSQIIRGGAMRLCNAMQNLEEYDIYFNHKVLAIHRHDHMMMVETSTATFRCGYIIMAIPPVKLLEISFNPPLPDNKIDVLNSMISADYKTCLLTYRYSAWNGINLSGDLFSGCPENALLKCFDIGEFKHHTIFAVLRQLDKEKVIAQLDKCYKIQPISYMETHWAQYLNYGYFYLPNLRRMREFHEIRRPLNRLFFGGSETATEWYGHIEGAIQAGVRSGIELMYDFKPQTLGIKDIVALIRRRKPISAFKDKSVIKFTNSSWKKLSAYGMFSFFSVWLIYRKITNRKT